jgi:hypothetical protein
MPIDPTIPLGIQQQPNPFQQIQQPIQTAQGLLALKQNQMQLGANQAISQAYSQSVNPDGSVDFNKLQSLAAQNGAGAYLPQFMGQIAQQRNAQQQYDTSKLDMALKQQQSIRGMIGSLATDPDMGKTDMSPKIAGQIVDAVQGGLLPQDQAIREIQSIPGDPRAQATWIQNHLINSLSGEAKLTALMPKQLTVNRGGETDILNVAPMSGALSVAGQLSNTLTPGEAASRIAAVGPDGTPGTVSLGSTVGGAQGGYTGRYNAQGGANGTPPGFVASGLSPAQQSASTGQGASSNSAAQTLHDAASDAPMRINLLETARDNLANINTGPGTAWRNTAASFINSTPFIGAIAQHLGIDPNNIKNYDEFNKILTNYASSVSGSLGTGTDARLNAAVTGNANPGISKMANDDILTKTMAAEKMRAAQDYAFQNSGLTTDKFNQWQAQWNKAVDPQAFVVNEMTPTQRAALKSRLGSQGWAKLGASYNTLVSQGLITPNAPSSAPAASAAPMPPSGVPR